jgi:hypothetical protein
MPPLSASSLPSPAHRDATHHVWWALSGWAVLALALSASGVLAGFLMRVPPPALIAALVAAVLVLHARWPALRGWARTVDLRLAVASHVVRAGFGTLFLVLAAQGRLSPLFATHAGWGDLAVGLLALPVAWVAARPTARARAAVLAWSTFGLVDILVTLGTAIHVFLSPARGELAMIAQTPLSILGTLVVPLILLTHLLVFARRWSA